MILCFSAEHIYLFIFFGGLCQPRSQFKFGRTTATTCDFAHGRLPNPENSCSAVKETFVDSMGLTWAQAAALMGVHTLGRAQVSNSGYNGWWSSALMSRKFNNDYFVSILAKGWSPEASVAGNPAKNQWKRADSGADEAALGKEMMLNTDLCFLALLRRWFFKGKKTCVGWI